MKKRLKYFSLSIMIFSLFLSCEVTNFDLQDNPNLLTPSSADPEFLLNELQYLFQDIMGDMNINTDDVMRYEALTSNYGDIVDSDVLDAEWERYFEALSISKTITNLASSNDGLIFHNAVNKLLMGYLTVTMVDYVGNIPYSEASQPNEFSNPKLDTGADLYKMVLTDIDAAISAINAAKVNVSSDLFYKGNKENWIAFANTFKLRILVQTRLNSSAIGVTDLKGQINTLLSGPIIDASSEDFVYSYSNSASPESRHPYYQRSYVEGFSQYICNYFMFMLKDSKSIRDPRIRYYLYRQSNIDPFSPRVYLACQGDPTVTYCYVGDGYWGLDQGEERTGRGDNLLRTVYGVYPAGGVFDEDQFKDATSTTIQNSSLLGAGIMPILTSSFAKFLAAEAALTIGTNGNPKTLLEEAVRASIAKVLNFRNSSSPYTSNPIDIENYVAEVLSNYENATTDEERLDVIITEYYLAGFGNSIEAYNAYRRTGYPSNIQIPITDSNPTFPRSFPYSAIAVMNNSSISQKQNTDKVFWDTNPAGFIK
jgi:hypothetical protein